jgi:hypothetical protein
VPTNKSDKPRRRRWIAPREGGYRGTPREDVVQRETPPPAPKGSASVSPAVSR